MSLAVIVTDETVENLRSDPRFMEFLIKINLDIYVLLYFERKYIIFCVEELIIYSYN